MNCGRFWLEDQGAKKEEKDRITRRKDELLMRIALLPHGKKKTRHIEELMELEVRLWRLSSSS